MLPKISHPTFDVVIPSTKKKIKLRPFTVKEEKILLMAKDSKDENDLIDGIIQIINNCSFDDLDTEKLATFDIEYLIVKLRSKSVSELVELNYKLGDEKIPFQVNLEEVQVKFNENIDRKFMVTDEYGITLNYPSIKNSKLYDATKPESLFKLVYSSVENIFDNDNVYDDFTEAEIEEFIMSLPSNAFMKITEFYANVPKLEHEVKIKNKEGDEKTIVLRGLKDFFIL